MKNIIKKSDDIKNIHDEIRHELKIIENNLYALFSEEKSDEFYEKIFDLQDDIVRNKYFIENGLNQEFSKLFKILIFMSSKIDTNHKEFKKKIFDILSKFKDNKEKTLDLSDNYIEYLDELANVIKELRDLHEIEKNKKKGFFKIFSYEFFKILFSSRFIQGAIAFIIIITILYIIHIADPLFYKDIIVNIKHLL